MAAVSMATKLVYRPIIRHQHAHKHKAVRYTGWVEKVNRKLLPISSQNIDRFSIFFTGTSVENL